MAKKDVEAKSQTLGEVGELGFLDSLRRRMAGAGSRGLLGGLTDDTAAWPTGGEPRRITLMTCDMLVEGTHFTKETTAARDLGYKALAVNVSDIAAQAGRPTFFTVGVGAPPDAPLAWLDDFHNGLLSAAREYDATLCGGDVVKAERFTIAVTLLGEFHGPRSALPLRSRMKTDDFLYVTGALGDAAAGLELLREPGLRKGLTDRDVARLIRRHQRPNARLREGQALGSALGRLAMIDLSDDLAFSLARLVECSGCGCQVELDSLPRSPALERFAEQQGWSAAELAIVGGEDFELLFACRAKPTELADIFRDIGVRTRLSCIGRACRERKIRYTRNSQPVEITPRAFQHFAP